MGYLTTRLKILTILHTTFLFQMIVDSSATIKVNFHDIIDANTFFEKTDTKQKRGKQWKQWKPIACIKRFSEGESLTYQINPEGNFQHSST